MGFHSRLAGRCEGEPPAVPRHLRGLRVPPSKGSRPRDRAAGPGAPSRVSGAARRPRDFVVGPLLADRRVTAVGRRALTIVLAARISDSIGPGANLPLMPEGIVPQPDRVCPAVAARLASERTTALGWPA